MIMDNKLATMLLDSDILFDLSCHNYTLEEAAQEIAKLLTPKLNWTDRSERSYSTGGGYMCVIAKIKDSYMTTAPSGFTGTLVECKHYCSVWVRDEYLKLCNG